MHAHTVNNVDISFVSPNLQLGPFALLVTLYRLHPYTFTSANIELVFSFVSLFGSWIISQAVLGQAQYHSATMMPPVVTSTITLFLVRIVLNPVSARTLECFNTLLRIPLMEYKFSQDIGRLNSASLLYHVVISKGDALVLMLTF